ncbi:MAG: thioredoxin domain-containing protein, partial [Ilumatobacteraceae bacterium]
KFPSTMNLDLVARRWQRTRQGADERVLRDSLDAMCSGGMYDHLGGGFARYSVDEKWLVPHFEKMLYDQALLLRVYTHAWQLLGSSTWKIVVEQTIDYLARDLRHPDGGFYSAEDADSLDDAGHSHEGAFYTWTPAEIAQVLPADLADEFCDWFDISPQGNFEGRSIPTRHRHRGRLARTPRLESACQSVLAARLERPRPGLDSKVVLEWNALAITALTEAGRAFDRPDWIQLAERCGEFLCAAMQSSDGSWFRTWQAEGTPPARHHAVAADLAALIDAFTRLAESTGRAVWVERAIRVADHLVANYEDSDRGGFFTVSAIAEPLVVRQKDLMDNATPSANSSAAVALLRLGTLLDRRDYIDKAHGTLRLLVRIMEAAPSAAGQSLAALDMVLDGITEVVLVGDVPELAEVVDRIWLPRAVVARGEPYVSPLWEHRSPGLAYVCRDYTCSAPTADGTTLRGLLG